jgi:Fe2+ or Zn2+ uptake regulation protein
MAKAIRQTMQKGMLRAEIGNKKSFFSAEDIYKKIKEKDSRLGIATVYRFLKGLRKNNKIHSYVCDRKTIYSFSEQNHCHFLCQKCGKTTHIRIDSIDFLRKNFRGSICHFQINVEGVCEKCVKNLDLD